MFKKSFKSKIILSAIFMMAGLAAVLTFYMTISFLSYSDELINEKLIANINSLKLHLHTTKNYSRAAAISMAASPEAIEAIKKKDREEILRIFSESHDVYLVNYYTVADENGVVLARTHEPEHFGDTIDKQQNIKDAMDGKISSYFETGTIVKVSVRTGAPVYDSDSTLIGIISAGVRFDSDEAVDKLKELLRSEITIFLGDTRINTTIFKDGERINGTKLSSDVAEIVIDGKNNYSGDAIILGEKYKVFYEPLLNAKDSVFAIFFIGNPLSELKAESDALIQNFIIIGCVGLLIAIVFLYLIISSISKPLVMLSEDIDKIENGNLNIEIKAKGNDEIGDVGRALQKVVNTVHKLIDDINITIFEHKNGNSEYRLNTDKFHGDFQLLATRIDELSNIGMKDQLTGLPNRHSLYTRMDLEWNRAKRDQTPLSLLMVDVDKFKSYNDNYGHQQGDVALQTTAKALSFPLKRGVDFVARWGGEEFIILLPNTDSDGAMHVAELVREKVATSEVSGAVEAAAKKISISVGVCTQIPTTDSAIEMLISRADEALYSAKKTGRNKVCKYDK